MTLIYIGLIGLVVVLFLDKSYYGDLPLLKKILIVLCLVVILFGGVMKITEKVEEKVENLRDIINPMNKKNHEI